MSKIATLPEVAAAVSALSKVLVVSHVNPDSDAYGSSLGLMFGLKSLGKEVQCINESGILVRYDFFPGVNSVLSSVPASFTPGPGVGVLVCDSATFERVGDRLGPELSKFEVIANLDHHVSNSFYAKLNLVWENASSTSEVVLALLKELKVKISPEIAFCLFSGISGDTGSFRYSNTSAQTLSMCSELVAAGANPHKIAQAMYGREPLSSVTLQADALLNHKLHFDGKVVELLVTDEMYKKHGSNPDEVEYLVERARDINGIVLSFLTRRDGDLWRTSLRSKDPKVDVSKIAAAFGGGGHRQAAAFRFRRDLEELRTKILAEIAKALEAK